MIVGDGNKIVLQYYLTLTGRTMIVVGCVIVTVLLCIVTLVCPAHTSTVAVLAWAARYFLE